MTKNLVIVESPAKAKTLEKFLGEDYKVMSSYGHIRDLKKKDFSVNLDDFTPVYVIPEDKEDVVAKLKKAAKGAENVWLASDEDREGEAISWHLAHVLGLDIDKTKRIVFHEITKNAILEAIKHPRTIDKNLVNAQQARRVLDRIVGFKLSPVLWKKLKPQLSAGRVQSVAVRLIVEREREIQNFKPEASFKVTAEFVSAGGGKEKTLLKAEYEQRFATEKEAQAFLEKCQGCQFTISDVTKKPMHKVPAPPFTTSTLQQEAARKLGFSVAQTMSVAQHLYEAGLITYMRTDSVNLSTLCINASKKEIIEKLGEKYSKVRQFQTKSKGAQEAHEAIRPTYMQNHEIKGGSNDKRLYDLIWKRTIASQMADAEIEKTTVRIDIQPNEKSGNNMGAFVATGEVVTFDGFLRVYRESFDDETEEEQTSTLDASLKAGQQLAFYEMTATQHYTQGPLRFTEASLVKKLEELGIGRPSTYAPTISTIQQREYVEKGDKKGEKRPYVILSMTADGKIKKSEKNEIVGNEKGKLIPTDTGIVVNDFLVKYFPNIVDYGFTANVEKEFDEIASGKEKWKEMMSEFYNDLAPEIDKVMNIQLEHKVGERVLGTDPATGREVSVKIGRFGPIVQIGTAGDEEKPRFAQLNKGQSIHSISLKEALELFKLPRTLGQLDGAEVSVGTGRFGPYVLHNRQYVSIPKGMDPMSITFEDAVQLIEDKKKQEASKHLKKFDEEPEMEIMNGRFGPYIAYKGKNYRIPKNIKEEPAQLSLEKCMEIIEKSKK
jgi:DNA topoisomerase-1